ncbi:MAG: cytochrome P450 [Streptosporangiaceae bacterium]
MNSNGAYPQLPFTQPDVLDVAPELRRLQAERPVIQVRTPAGDLAWLVTRYDHVRALAADPRIGNSHDTPAEAPRFSESALLGRPAVDKDAEARFSNRVRKLLTPAFTPRRVRTLQARVDELAADLLQQMAAEGPPADFQDRFSVPLPVMVICGLLGVPYEDYAKFREWSDIASGMADEAKAGAAFGELISYMHPQIERKRSEPGDDVISDLVGAGEEWQLTNDDIALFAGMLLFAGHASTSIRIDFGTLLLLANPGQRDALRRDPGLAPRAVEEIIRMTAPGDSGLTRYANADIEIGGVTIRKGEAVLLSTAMANRDEQAFPDPDRFDVTRDPNPHLGFGHGRRFCIGASLARAELTAVVGQLFTQLPALRLATGIDQLWVRTDLLPGGLSGLPVTWE